MLSNRFSLFGLTVAATLALAGSASAAIVINAVSAPASATPTLVSGTGARANGPVELLVNGVSVGSVQADGSGAWSITANIKSGDNLRAFPNQVWNFNTDGNLEGWAGAGGNVAVSGGALILTESGGDTNSGIHLSGLGNINDPSLPVLEIGYRTNASAATSGTTFSMSSSSDTGFFGPAWRPTTGTAGFTVDVIDMTRTSFGNNNPDYPAGPAYQIGFAFNGIADGQTLEVDFVRMRETMRYDFPYANDPQWTNPGTNNPGGATTVTVGNASAGFLILTPAGAGAAAIAPAATSGPNKDGNIYVNSSVFNTFNIRASMVGSNSGAIVDMLHHNGTTFTTLSSGKLYSPNYTGTNVYSVSLTDANWLPNGAFINNFTWLQLYNPLAATDTMTIDYFEFAPSTFTGDSARVTVSLNSSVSEWQILD